jgi:hypothetical protein
LFNLFVLSLEKYDVKSDPFEELSVSYFYKIPLWCISIFALITFVLFVGIITSISINLCSRKHLFLNVVIKVYEKFRHLKNILLDQNYSSYGQNCDKYIECDPSRNLICSSNGTCMCLNQNLYWKNNNCSKFYCWFLKLWFFFIESYKGFKKSYGEVCESSNECLSGLSCSENSSNICNCPVWIFWHFYFGLV